LIAGFSRAWRFLRQKSNDPDVNDFIAISLSKGMAGKHSIKQIKRDENRKNRQTEQLQDDLTGLYRS